MRINPDIQEKPDHLHYPACLGRKTEIEKQSLEILLYTLAALAFPSIISIMGVRFAMFSALPDIIFGEDGVKTAFFQVFEFFMIAVLALLGCTKYKVFDVIVMLIYILMVIISLLFNETTADALIVIAGLGGIWKSIGSYKAWNDYEQLMNTEGFPIFSITLAEHDEKIANEKNGIPSQPSGIDPTIAAQYVMSQLSSGNADKIMPAIGELPQIASSPSARRYMPEGQKESVILESPMKFDV
ncbi:MAG: hypothetical protein K6B38_09670 [Ruminococcus sp.]|nr:hypothetical protein [Ruminococcus sp.]